MPCTTLIFLLYVYCIIHSFNFNVNLTLLVSAFVFFIFIMLCFAHNLTRYDPSRDYPYTVRVHGTGQRGRVLPEEIALISGNPEDRFVAKLKPGESYYLLAYLGSKCETL